MLCCFVNVVKVRGLKGHWRGDLSSVNFVAPAGTAKKEVVFPSTREGDP